MKVGPAVVGSHDRSAARLPGAREDRVDLIGTADLEERQLDPGLSGSRLELIANLDVGPPGPVTTATRDVEGTASLRSSTYFWLSPGTRLVSPVTLPPGRARLATRPSPTGSRDTVMTMGIRVVARFAAFVSGVEVVTRTSTFFLTRSATRAGRSSRLPAANACVTTRLRPST
jgi:hypothetical protein